jgi:hypothetical protein
VATSTSTITDASTTAWSAIAELGARLVDGVEHLVVRDAEGLAVRARREEARTAYPGGVPRSPGDDGMA